MIDQSTVSQIIEAANVIDVVQDFVSLKKRGSNFIGLCPFHNEKTPSFSVSPSKGLYKCFGCGKAGSSVSFVMEHEQLTYPEALRYLAKKYQIDIIEHEQTTEEIQQKNDRESMLVVNTFANRYFSDILHKNEEGKKIGLSYFRERRFREDIIKKFELGYCPEGYDNFTKAARRAGYKMEFLAKTGLTIAKETRSFDRFSGRVMFPIHALSGKVIAFGGRTLKTDKKVAKYLNSPESEIYHKSSILYGIYFAKRTIVKHEKCFMVEGYTDVISMHQAGIENVVASSGTSLTSGQIRLVKRFTENLTIIYDGDAAGIKASLRGIDLVLEEGMNVRIVLLPEGEDPDSFSHSHTAEELLAYIKKNEEDFIQFKTKLLIEESQNDPVKRASLITDIVRTIAVIPQQIMRSVYLKDCSKLLEVDEQVLYSEAAKLRRDKYDKSEKYAKAKQKRNVTAPIQQSNIPNLDQFCYSQERELIRVLLRFGRENLFEIEPEQPSDDDEFVYAENVSNFIKSDEFIISELENDEIEFTIPEFQAIYDEYRAKMNDPTFDAKYFINHEDEIIAKTAGQILAMIHDLSNIWRKNESYVVTEEMTIKELVPGVVTAFKFRKVELALKTNDIEMKKAHEEKNMDVFPALMKKTMMLNEVKKVLAKELNDRIII